jgi:predicted RNase H-like HicB family nuclease
MRYAVVIEKASNNFSAYVPDVPGCVSAGSTVEETLVNIREALLFHFDGMREDGDPLPDPQTLVDYVDVPIAQPAKTSAA